MNDRIKLLAEQANIRFGRMAILDGDPRGMARFVSYSEFEKFAESLIRECLSGLEQDRYAYADDCNWDTEYDEGFVDGIYRAETLIREIFGVK